MILALDLSWFTTIPGMLITGGVLLLIIALIIFIVTSGKKGDKNEKVAAVQEQAQMNVAQTMPTATTMPEVNIGVGTAQPTMDASPVVPTEPSVFTTPISTGFEPQEAVPIVAPTEVAPVPVAQEVPTTFEVPTPIPTNTVSEQGNVEDSTIQKVDSIPDSPVVEPVKQDTIVMPQVVETPTSPVVAEPVAPVVTEPTVPQPAPQPVESMMPEKEIPVAQPTTAPIYGGVSSIIPDLDVTSQPERPIYGGANPLDNTQTIPAQPAPTVMPEPVAPVVTEPTVPQPAPQPVVAETPAIEETPSSQILETPTQVIPTIPVTQGESPKVSEAPQPESLF